MRGAMGERPWRRAGVALLGVVLVLGCGRRTLTGKTVKVAGEEGAAIEELIEKAAGYLQAGKDKQVSALMKRGLPRAEQAKILNTLAKLAEAPGWEIEAVERFGDAYFRATLQLQGDPGGAVTVSVFREEGGFVLTGGG